MFAVSSSPDIPYFLLFRTEEYARLYIFLSSTHWWVLFETSYENALASYPGGDTAISEEKYEHRAFVAEQCSLLHLSFLISTNATVHQ